MYQIMNYKASSLKQMEQLQEDIMQEEKLCRRSHEVGYGGPLCIRIPSIVAGHVMYVKK